jgi:hypothetical protein
VLLDRWIRYDSLGFDDSDDVEQVTPCQWNDRDGCDAKEAKPFQCVDLQPYNLDLGG